MGQEKWENNRQKQNNDLYYTDRRSKVAQRDGAGRKLSSRVRLNKRVRSELVSRHSVLPRLR